MVLHCTTNPRLVGAHPLHNYRERHQVEETRNSVRSKVNNHFGSTTLAYLVYRLAKQVSGLLGNGRMHEHELNAYRASRARDFSMDCSIVFLLCFSWAAIHSCVIIPVTAPVAIVIFLSQKEHDFLKLFLHWQGFKCFKLCVLLLEVVV